MLNRKMEKLREKSNELQELKQEAHDSEIRSVRLFCSAISDHTVLQEIVFIFHKFLHFFT